MQQCCSMGVISVEIGGWLRSEHAAGCVMQGLQVVSELQVAEALLLLPGASPGAPPLLPGAVRPSWDGSSASQPHKSGTPPILS